MWIFSFISAVGCSYLCLACSLLGLLLPALLAVLWMEKEVQTLFRDILSSWTVQRCAYKPRATMGGASSTSSSCSWQRLGPVCSAGHHGGIQTMDARALVSRGSWERPWQESTLWSGPPCLDLSAHLSTYLQPYPQFFTRKAGREVTIPPACRYLLAPSGALQHVEQSYKNLKSHLVYRLVYRMYVFLLWTK